MIKAEDYPALDLPVAQFARPEDAKYYQGASALANLVLRRAIDHAPKDGPSVRKLLAARNLWLRATFEDANQRRTQADIQVNSRIFWLKAKRHPGAFAMRWTQQPDGLYVPDMVHQEDPVLPYPGDQKSMKISPQTYDTLPTHHQFQADPALRFSAAFSYYQKELETLPPDYAKPISINIEPTL